MTKVKYCDIQELRIVPCLGRKTPWGFFAQGQGDDGYGRKISTQYEVRLRGEGERWYKVYASCFSNVACFYTTKGYCHDKIFFTEDWEISE